MKRRVPFCDAKFDSKELRKISQRKFLAMMVFYLCTNKYITPTMWDRYNEIVKTIKLG